MADWLYKKDVKFNTLYQRIPNIFNEYLLTFDINNEKSSIPDRYEMKIDSSNLEQELLELKNGKKDRCYFAFGMQDIDIYKIKEGKFGITHSPYEGLNLQLILSDCEFEKILDCFKSR